MGGEIYNKIILASASPRRSELLARAGIPFEVRVSDAAEDNSQGIEPSELVHRNALAKALSVAARFPERTVLGADTIVSLGGKIYGKPADLRDAERMLRELSGKTHSVFTGVAFAKGGGKKSAAFADVQNPLRKRNFGIPEMRGRARQGGRVRRAGAGFDDHRKNRRQLRQRDGVAVRTRGEGAAEI